MTTRWLELFILIGFLIPIVLHDIREKKIPDIYIIPGFCLLLLTRFLFRCDFSFWFLLDIAIGFLFIWILWFVTGGKIGLGDAKLSGMIALVLGAAGWFFALFIASFSGLVTGMILLRMKKIKKEEGIPFAPFLAAGGVVSFVLKDLDVFKDLSVFKDLPVLNDIFAGLYNG
ncbi:MAG: prepilin peptidase [Spirochaetales bacterium]|nr:prepilin peptidase [Spirochaetales bacterium]